MNVTFCDYASPNLITGPTVWLERLLPELRRIGVESRVLFIRRASGEVPTIDLLRAQGFACNDVLHVGYTEERIRWMLNDVRAHCPDVFIPNMVIPAYYAARWVREMGIPTVGVLHSDSDYYQALQEVFINGAEEFKLSAVVPVSQKLERDVVNASGVLVKRIPCGAPLPAQTAAPPKDKLRLIYMGRLEEEQKRISDTTRALCRAAREIPGVEAVIYGDGSARENVTRIMAEAGGVPVAYGGRVAPEDVLRVMASAHVFVLLSDYEGLPVALLEALACGLVPVCLNIPSGIPEVVTDKVNGLLVNDREDDFVKAIVRLKESPELWQRLSQAAQKRFAEEFEIAATARQWKDLFETLQANRPPASTKKSPLKLPSPHPALKRLDRRKSLFNLNPFSWNIKVNK